LGLLNAGILPRWRGMGQVAFRKPPNPGNSLLTNTSIADARYVALPHWYSIMPVKFCATWAATLLLAGTAWAQSESRFVERAPLPRVPIEHTMARAGNADRVARFARPSVDTNIAGGYIGGNRLLGNRILARGYSASVGATTNGTYGTDYTGVFGLAGRVFLRESEDPSRGADVAKNYRTGGPEVPDVVAAQPIRKARLEKDADHEKK